MTASRRACASSLRFCTSVLNCAGGGPSIDSNATVAPRGCAADMLGWPSWVQPASAIAQAAATAKLGEDTHDAAAPKARRPQPHCIDTPAALFLVLQPPGRGGP